MKPFIVEKIEDRGKIFVINEWWDVKNTLSFPYSKIARNKLIKKGLQDQFGKDQKIIIRADA